MPPYSLGERVNRMRAAAVDICLLKYREGSLTTPAWLEQARKVRARPQLGISGTDDADPGIPFRLPVTIAMVSLVLAC
jgi:hypothetical protein